MQLTGRVALVTGGAHRIGRAIALALAKGGADVVVNYHESQDEAAATVAEIEALGRSALAVRADVSRRDQVSAMVEETEARFGRLDLLVNNASLFLSTPFLAIPEEEWDRVLAVNLKGPFLTMQAAVPLLRADSGLVVNIADLSGLQPWSGYAHHSVSKAGLVHLTRVAARALGPLVRVNCIAPGAVLPPSDYSQQQIAELREETVLDRIGSPEDVVRALQFVVESDFTTGTVVVVDGGRLLL